jgi:hypothetical protein
LRNPTLIALKAIFEPGARHFCPSLPGDSPGSFQVIEANLIEIVLRMEHLIFPLFDQFDLQNQ